MTPSAAKEIIEANSIFYVRDVGFCAPDIVVTAARAILAENVALKEGVGLHETELRKKETTIEELRRRLRDIDTIPL